MQLGDDIITLLPQGKTRTLDHVEGFGKEIGSLINKLSTQLAGDLGISVPKDNSPEYKDFKKELVRLSGHTQLAIDELAKPLKDIFTESIGFEVPSIKEINSLSEKLNEFQSEAIKKIDERLKWAIKEKSNKKLPLMLAAAEHFDEGSEECPVCTQSLKPVPHIKESLEELRPLISQTYIKKEIRDLERDLIEGLDKIVSAQKRSETSQTLEARVKSDWEELKRSRFPSLLDNISKKFDQNINELSKQVRSEPLAQVQTISNKYKNEFPDAFKKLDMVINSAREYISLVRSVDDNLKVLELELTKITKQKIEEGATDSLSMILMRGNAVNENLAVLPEIQTTARELYKSQKELNDHVENENKYRKISAAAETIKSLGEYVQEEVVQDVVSVGPQMKAYYQHLYGEEILPLDMLTPGHPANQYIKNEINAYLKAGDERIPVGPFSNTGRFRALILSFIFALLEKSKGSLGILILDDPALSFDDDHKARFVDNLVLPQLSNSQVILATHYESFYKDAEYAFPADGRIQLPPRRIPCDAVIPEPADLLQRVEESINKQNCSWREVGCNLRRYIERTLHTISGYCPNPFVKFNDIPQSIGKYKNISDPQIATENQKKIIDAFESPKVARIMHPLAHDENRTKPEVEDALKVLQTCSKHVRYEIERFKELYSHQRLARSLESRPNIVILPRRNLVSDTDIKIVEQAAAATNGIGDAWGEDVTVNLSGYQIALAKLDTLSPIVLTGQYLLLDPEEEPPKGTDLVIAKTGEGDKYLRRYWQDERGIIDLVSENPTNPYSPKKVMSGDCSIRRIVGVLYKGVSNCSEGSVGKEWVQSDGQESDILNKINGIRVNGTSLEPIARNGQVILVLKESNSNSIQPGDLACVDINQSGAVIKRCYPGDPNWTLISVNPINVEDPINVPVADILHVYPLMGVLFEHHLEI